MTINNLKLKLLKDKYGVCRINNTESIPEWAKSLEFSSITRTKEELSIVCAQYDIPDDIQCEKDWRILKIAGPLDFSLVGILAFISTILADCDVSIFAISTYDTDYILVKEKYLSKAIESLEQKGYEVLHS